MNSLVPLAVVIISFYLFGRIVTAIDRESFGFREGQDGEDAPSWKLKIVARTMAIAAIAAALYFPEGGLKIIAFAAFVIGMA